MQIHAYRIFFRIFWAFFVITNIGILFSNSIIESTINIRCELNMADDYFTTKYKHTSKAIA